jgi:glycosyltransferase involved in cell wall biosynthesis
MLSRYFPPRFDVGGKRAHRFASVLPRLGWRPVVVTGREPPSERADPSAADPEGAVIARVYEPWWWREGPVARPSDGTVAAPVKAGPARPGGGAAKPGRLGIPVGPEMLAVPHLVRAATRVGRRERADVVWATSSPYAVLPAGARVAKRLGVPLILDLRDPWTLNFMHRSKPVWVQEADRRIEARLFSQAARVVFTCEAAAAAYRARYPALADRIVTIRNAYDPELEPGSPEPSQRSGPIRLLHFGNCYGPRRLATVLRAMARLRAEQPDAPEVVLDNLGRVGEADLELARELGLEQRFTWRPFVPLREGLERLAAADLAILVAYGDETLYIPAKFYDYMLARASIACLTREGELAELVEQSGAGRAIAPDDVDGALAVIERAIAARAAGERAFGVDEAARERFSSVHASEQLAQLLDQVLAERSPAR